MNQNFIKEMNDAYDKAEKSLSEQYSNGLQSWMKNNSHLYSKYAMFALTTEITWNKLENSQELKEFHAQTLKRHTEFMKQVALFFPDSQ